MVKMIPRLGLGLFAFGRLLLSHLLLHLFAALGTRVSTLLALLVENLLGSEQLDEGLLRSIALLEAGANDAQVAAVAIAVARRDRVKKPRYGFTGLQESESLTP